MTSRRELGRLFRRERARFARAFPHVAATRLVVLARACTGAPHCGWRDVAYATTGPGAPRVAFLARALVLPAPNLVGLIRHELGHVADPWIERAGREQRADDIAEWVTGERIYYDRRFVQTIGRGRWPRPAHLHQ